MPIPEVVLPSAPVLCWITPPVQSALFGAVTARLGVDPLTEPPQGPLELPVTVSPPLDPVVSRTIPSPELPVPVPVLIDRNVRLAATRLTTTCSRT